MKAQRTNFIDDVWLTPEPLLRKLGLFDLDPCAPLVRPWEMARRHFTIADDGLKQEWFGRVWLNPPYTGTGKWVSRMATHGNGIALVNARTDTNWFADFVFAGAQAVTFVTNRIIFCREDGKIRGRGWNASVLAAYSETDSGILYRSGIAGQFIPLVFKFTAGVRNTWRQVVRWFLRECGGVATLEQLYELVSGHPKTAGNPNWPAKVRQVVQREAKRVGPGTWQIEGVGA